VVANGAEGEPASSKDGQLLVSAPHLVLDGLQLAALAVGADTAYAYVRAGALPAVRTALAERVAAGGDRVAVTLVEAVDSFVSGQETAVVSRLDAGPARPRFSRTRITEKGIGGRPTLVQNVETLAHLALVARYGGAWFTELGTPDSTGTFLVTVHPPAGRPIRSGTPETGRVWEVPHGLPLARLLESAVATPVEDLQAVLVGGYHGGWVPLPAGASAPLSRAGLADFGVTPGAGVLIPLGHDSCGLQTTARIVRYLASESAKQCGPCRFGLPHLATMMTTLADGPAGPGDVARLREAVGLVEGRGACHHPDGTARLVRSALQVFEKDVVLHGHGCCTARMSEPYGGAA
jgi:NADH:ubiquinone oxidoreductase subunit F (NADH-binding)